MFIERLNEYLKAKSLSFTWLEKKLGTGNGTLLKAYKTGSAIGSDKIEKILVLFDDLSAEWLLRGKGEMIISIPESADAMKVQMLERQVDQLTKEKDNYWSLIIKLTERNEQTQ